VRPNAVSTLNCMLCPLLAVSCGDAGLALFTLSRLRDWTIVTRLHVALTIRIVPQFRRLVAGFPLRRTGFDPKSRHMGFMVDKMALGQVFSQYFSFPSQFLLNQMFLHSQLSFGAGTIGQINGRRTKWTPSHPRPTKLKVKNVNY
jgi:hypothetical protein